MLRMPHLVPAVLASSAHFVSAQSGPTSSTAARMSTANDSNIKVEKYLGWIWAGIISAALAYRLLMLSIRHVRTIASLGHDRVRYFARPNATYARFQRHLLDAPLLRKRHHREFKLSAAVNVGTLPSRFQTLFIAAYLGVNVALAVVLIEWSGEFAQVAGVLRNRTGILAVMNMVPLFLLAGRNNPLIWLLDISYDTFNLVHRWIGRIVVLEALAHTLAWTVSRVRESGWTVVGEAMQHSQLIMTGTIGMAAFLCLFLQSPSIVRHAYYEVFLHAHFLLALAAVVAVWIHLNTLPQQALLLSALTLWIAERLMRVWLVVRNNVGAGGTKAEVEALTGDAIRVTLQLARPWTFQPGQHAYLYIPAIGWWTSHPFSLAWSEDAVDPAKEKILPMERSEILAMRKTTVSLIIRRRTGFTEKMWKKAASSPTGTFVTRAIVEGPYGEFRNPAR